MNPEVKKAIQASVVRTVVGVLVALLAEYGMRELLPSLPQWLQVDQGAVNIMAGFLLAQVVYSLISDVAGALTA